MASSTPGIALNLIGKKPNKIIQVPPEFRRDTFPQELQMIKHEVKTHTGCDVCAHWSRAQGAIVRFDVYGSGRALDKATRWLNKWISWACNKSKRSTIWAKIAAFNFNEWWYEMADHIDNERRKGFLEPAPKVTADGVQLHSRTVDWPKKLTDAEITPRDAFGNKLENLNRLRMQDQVYLTLLTDRTGVWKIEIKGYHVHAVETGEEHIFNLIQLVLAEAQGQHHTFNMILDTREGLDVVLQMHEPWWPEGPDKLVPRLQPSGIMNIAGSFSQDGIESAQISSIRTSIKLALEIVKRKPAYYDFVVRLGCLAMSAKHVPMDKIETTRSKGQFLREINSKIDMNVKRWVLSAEDGHRVLKLMMAAKELLEPIRSSTYFGKLLGSLDKTRPSFRGVWVFEDPDIRRAPPAPAKTRQKGRPALLNTAPAKPADNSGPPASLFVVQVDWTEDEDGLFEKTLIRYFKTEPGNRAPKKNMDINLLELGESRGWQFAMDSLVPLIMGQEPPALTKFAEDVRMKPDYKVSDTKAFASWDNTRTVQDYLYTRRLEKIYSFGIRDTCFKLELSAVWYPSSLPVWSIGVRHIEWETLLTELEGLGFGDQANWGDSVSTFFPKNGGPSTGNIISDLENMHLDDEKGESSTGMIQLDDDGLKLFVDKLMKISELVSQVTAGGGVRI